MNITTIIAITAGAFLAGAILGLVVDKYWMPRFMDPVGEEVLTGMRARINELEQWLACRDRTIAGYDKQLNEKDMTIRVLQDQHDKDHSAILNAANLLRERAYP